ncbi:diguanylate cyclase, partial [Acinetobacter baumannii]
VEIPDVGRISASIGVATFPQHADDPDILLKRADEALYVAKQSGRNQVKTSTASTGLHIGGAAAAPNGQSTTPSASAPAAQSSTA